MGGGRLCRQCRGGSSRHLPIESAQICRTHLATFYHPDKLPPTFTHLPINHPSVPTFETSIRTLTFPSTTLAHPSHLPWHPPLKHPPIQAPPCQLQVHNHHLNPYLDNLHVCTLNICNNNEHLLLLASLSDQIVDCLDSPPWIALLLFFTLGWCTEEALSNSN